MGLTIVPGIVKVLLALLTMAGAIEAATVSPVDVMKAYLEAYAPATTRRLQQCR